MYIYDYNHCSNDVLVLSVLLIYLYRNCIQVRPSFKMSLYNTIQYNTMQNPFIAIGYILVTTDI